MGRRRLPSVIVRPPRPSDRDAFLTLVRGSRALHRPWMYPPHTRTMFDAYVVRCRRDDFAGFLIFREDTLVGCANLSQIFLGAFRNAYLGYWIGAGFEGQGLMRAGLSKVLDEGFGPIGLHRVEANVQPGNAPSIALVKTLGFRLEGLSKRYLKIGGRWRDHQRWAITKEEW